MKITRRTNILIKTEREFIVKQHAADEPLRCEHCGGQMISAQMSADFFAVSSRTIYRLIETETIHFLETEANEVYVCLLSARRILESLEARA